jgi:hypothetical protein
MASRGARRSRAGLDGLVLESMESPDELRTRLLARKTRTHFHEASLRFMVRPCPSWSDGLLDGVALESPERRLLSWSAVVIRSASFRRKKRGFESWRQSFVKDRTLCSSSRRHEAQRCIVVLGATVCFAETRHEPKRRSLTQRVGPRSKQCLSRFHREKRAMARPKRPESRRTAAR